MLGGAETLAHTLDEALGSGGADFPERDLDGPELGAAGRSFDAVEAESESKLSINGRRKLA